MHAQGVVLGEIVKANIPVRNGVVHLIHRPLVIVDTTVVQFLEVRSSFDWLIEIDDQFREIFARYIKTCLPRFVYHQFIAKTA